MNSVLGTSRAVKRPLALLAATALLVAACAGSTTTTPGPATAGTPTAGAPTAAPTAEKTLEIAYISFAVANSYDAPMLAAAQASASAGNAKLTVFDGNLDPPTQTKQLQDAVASGKYDGIVLQPVYGAGLVEGAKAAIAAGIGRRQHRPDPGRGQHDRRDPGRGPARERGVRPERARAEDRRARRGGLRHGQPVQRRLHLVGQGAAALDIRAQGGVRQGDLGQSGDQDRGRGRVVLHDRARPQGVPGHAAGPPGHQRHHRARTRPSPAPSRRSRT